MAVLTAAERIRLGTPGAMRVYAGSTLAWQFKRYLNSGVAIVSTADTPDMTIDGNIRFTARLRDDSAESAGSRYAIIKGQVAGNDLSWAAIATFSTNFYNFLAWPTGSTSPQLGSVPGTRTLFGLTPPGTDRYVGTTITGVTPGNQALTLKAIGLTSTDGVTWTQLGGTAPAVRGDAMSRDSATPLRIGSNNAGAPVWIGRIYWAQMEAINRAQLVFPGESGNSLRAAPTTGAIDAVTGDMELVARWSRPSLTWAFAQIINKDTAGPRGMGWSLTPSSQMQFTLRYAGAPFTATSAAVAAWQPDTMYWVKVTRVAATGLVSFFWAPDSPTEPTTWTAAGTTTGTTGAADVGSPSLELGASFSVNQPFNGRLARVIMRNGIAGTTVFDMSENDAGTMATSTTFTATTGQTVTVAQSGQLVFPGVAGNYLSVPDSAALDIIGDIEIVLRVNPTTWRPAVQQSICAKYMPPGNQRSWQVLFNGNTGQVMFRFTPGGLSTEYYDYGSELFAANAGPQWLKFTRVRSTGMSSWFKAPDQPTEPTTWTASATPLAVQPGMAIFAGTAPVEIGSISGGTAQNYAGRIPQVIIRSGIAGTVVLNIFDANTTTPGQTSFTASVGGTVTVNQTAGNTIVQARQPIVQPQADRMVWRFDADEYPGTGTSYTDPRGRVWTLSAAGAIAGP